MSQLRTVLLAKVRAGLHAVALVRRESKLKVGVVSVAGVTLWLGAFVLFYQGFRWLRYYTLDPTGGSVDLGDIIMARLLSVFALTLFLMLVFSNILIAFSTLYRSREVAYLVQSPMSFRSIFLARFAESVVFSSWASAFLGSPLILAYGWASSVPVAFYAAAALFYVPFVCIPAALGSIVAMGLVRFWPRLNRAGMIAISLGILVGLFLFVRQRLDVERLTDQLLVTALLEATARTQSPFFPSYWAANGVLAAATRDYSECLFAFLLLLSNALMFTWLATETAHRIFYPGWSSTIGQDRARLKLPGRGPLGWLEKSLGFLREPTRSLVVKDVKLFWRDPTQWSQFVIFFGLMTFYVANLRNRGLAGESLMWRTWVACLNMAACSLILATLTSRFVYPLVSLEGRRFWIVGLAPLTFRQLVWQKFWLSVATCSCFTFTLVILSGIVLRLEPLPFALSVYTIVVTNFALSGLAVGLGALYPNFQEDNPARIVSGMGGTLNFLLSMAYILVIVGALTTLMLWPALHNGVTDRRFTLFASIVISLTTLVSAAGTLLPMRLGLRHLRSMEF